MEHPVYVCVYLALAIVRDAVFVTADARFHARVEASDHRGRTRSLRLGVGGG